MTVVFIEGASGAGKSSAVRFLSNRGFRPLRLFRGAGEHKTDPGWMRAAGVPYNDWIEDFVLLETLSQLQLKSLVVCDRSAISGLVWEKLAAQGLHRSDHPLPPKCHERIRLEIDWRLLSFSCMRLYLDGTPEVFAERCRQSVEAIRAEMQAFELIIGRSDALWTGINTVHCSKEETHEAIWKLVGPLTRETVMGD